MSLTWIYCLGHVGVHGNEMAPRLAEEAKIRDRPRKDKSDIAKAVLDKMARK